MTCRSVAWALPLLLAGCGGAKILEVDGFTTTQQEYDAMLEAVRPAASFAWDCPTEQIRVKVLEVARADSGAAFYKGASWLRSVGVEGCGQKAIYVKITHTGQWVANVYSQ